jgi:hypothetical protein
MEAGTASLAISGGLEFDGWHRRRALEGEGNERQLRQARSVFSAVKIETSAGFVWTLNSESPTRPSSRHGSTVQTILTALLLYTSL